MPRVWVILRILKRQFSTITHEFGIIGSVLEIGCGEELQSLNLSEICDIRKFLYRVRELGKSCVISDHAPHLAPLELKLTPSRIAEPGVSEYDTFEWSAS